MFVSDITYSSVANITMLQIFPFLKFHPKLTNPTRFAPDASAVPFTDVRLTFEHINKMFSEQKKCGHCVSDLAIKVFQSTAAKSVSRAM